MPLSRSQWSALLAATGRELGWGVRAVAREIRCWRAQAEQIPDLAVRADALAALDGKRGHADGAAMFWTLPPRRDTRLLRALVRYELLQDFLDGVTEPSGSLGPTHGEQLYRALGDALDPDRPLTDYYRRHPARGDGGYLRTLVQACREDCGALPGYAAVRPLLLRDADRADVLIANHQPDADARAAALRRWAERRFPEGCHELHWFELTAAASGWITTHALLASAASATITCAEAEAVYAAYFPWLALALTLIDAYVDQADDVREGNHNYLVHYASPRNGIDRLRSAIDRAARAVLALPSGQRHGVLLACMIALYLSKDAARTDGMLTSTAEIASVGGTLTRTLVPVLRAWRLANGQRSKT